MEDLTGYASIDKPWKKKYSNFNISKEEIEKKINK